MSNDYTAFDAWPYEDVIPKEEGLPTWECPSGWCTCNKRPDTDLFELSVMLCDPTGARMPGARCRVLANGKLLNRDQPSANGDGWITVEAAHAPRLLFIEWAPPGSPSLPHLPYRMRYYARLDVDRDAAGRQRLNNLGFSHAESLHDLVCAFQYHYGHPALTGRLTDIEADLIAFHDEARVPLVVAPRGVQALPPPPKYHFNDIPAVAPVSPTTAGRAEPPPAPPPPSSLGNEKTGGGTIPGQGTLRPPRPYLWHIRVLGWNLEPRVSTPCRVLIDSHWSEHTTDTSGIVRVPASEYARRATVHWTAKAEIDTPVERDDLVLMGPHHRALPDSSGLGTAIDAGDHRDLSIRLHNLGHPQSTLDEQVVAYQLELGREPTGEAGDINSESTGFHDGGSTPPYGTGGGSPSGATPLQQPPGYVPPPVTTATPLPKVALYTHPDHPGVYKYTRKLKDRIISIFRGQHTAITLLDSNGIGVFPNNPINAVPDHAEVWVDKSQSANPRHIFFHGWALPTSHGMVQTSLFHVGDKSSGPPWRTALQVRVVDGHVQDGASSSKDGHYRQTSKSHLKVRLFGDTMVVNQTARLENTEAPPFKYDLDDNRSVTYDDLRPIIKYVYNYAVRRGTLDHLVINAHGSVDKVCLGSQFIKVANVYEFDALKGKVKFIWVQSCKSGFSNDLMGLLAFHTQAWVTAYVLGTPDVRVARNHIDYPVNSSPKHWYGPDCSKTKREPKGARAFFEAARATQDPNLGPSLYFNIIGRV